MNDERTNNTAQQATARAVAASELGRLRGKLQGIIDGHERMIRDMQHLLDGMPETVDAAAEPLKFGGSHAEQTAVEITHILAWGQANLNLDSVIATAMQLDRSLVKLDALQEV